jgi:ubiquinone/menaquinone biosynthesis C-methylase UbiE
MMMKSQDLMELALSFQKSRIFLTAYELGIFTAIGKKSKSSSQLADELGSAKRHTNRLMNALCSLGILRKAGERFSNTPLSLKYLVNSSPDFLKGIAHNVNMWDSWSALTQTIRHGRPAMDVIMNARGEKWLDSFIAAMHEYATKSASAIVKSLDLSGVSRVLDVGGGSGAYAMAFVRQRKAIAATVFDLSNVVLITKRYIDKQRLSSKVKVVSGDFNTDSLGSDYDLVFISAIIHMNSFKQNMELVHKAAHALRGNGQIVIQDFIMDDDRLNPPLGSFFALNMLLATKSGDTYTESEARIWLKEAGFTNIKRKDTESNTSLIIGRKKT